MKRQLREFRLLASGLMITVGGIACATGAPSAHVELSTQQTTAMVRAGRFAALDEYYGRVQRSYDERAVSDEKLRSEFRHFYDSSPDLAARYTAWVKEMPGSYVAHLARAIYCIRVGEKSRGNLVIADTSDAQVNGMEASFAVASGELERSLSLERKPLLSVFYQLDIGKFQGEAARNRELLDSSLAMDAGNFIVREMYMMTLQTAWGGSTEEMKAFVADCGKAGLSQIHMKDLQSMVFGDEAWVDEYDNGNLKRAAAEYLEAARLSGDEVCLLCAGKALAKAGEFRDSARILTQYLAHDPESAQAMGWRAYVNAKLGHRADAMSDYEHAAQLGDAESQYDVGMWYLLGVHGLPKDRAAGVRWLTRAAAQGNQAAKKILPVALDKRVTILEKPR